MSLEDETFSGCDSLARVLLNDGLETICEQCFKNCRLEEVAVPSSVRYIGPQAFGCDSLRRVRFLGAPQRKASSPSRSAGDSEKRCQLVIGEKAFYCCGSLRQVVFDPGSAVEEIQFQAFYRAGLESFTAPPSLRRVGDLAFEGCAALKDLRLHEDVRELGWLCLWKTAVANVRLPPRAKMTPEQLGVGQTDPRVLRLPDGLESVGSYWFMDGDVEKLVVPSSVRVFGACAFMDCGRLWELAFEPGSRLEVIGDSCFSNSGLRKVVIPRSVRDIGQMAFQGC